MTATKRIGRPPVPLIERILPRLVITECPLKFDRLGRPIIGPCLVWTGALHKGYGTVWVNEEQACRRIHRVMYQLFVGPISDPIDHLYRVTACANPDHLEDVSAAENVARADTPTSWSMMQTHCKEGHEYNEANTRVEFRDDGIARVCRPCGNARGRARHRKRRGLPLDMPNRMDPNRTTCVNGHPRTEENVYLVGRKTQEKRCRSCDRENRIRFQAHNPDYMKTYMAQRSGQRSTSP